MQMILSLASGWQSLPLNRELARIHRGPHFASECLGIEPNERFVAVISWLNAGPTHLPQPGSTLWGQLSIEGFTGLNDIIAKLHDVNDGRSHEYVPNLTRQFLVALSPLFQQYLEIRETKAIIARNAPLVILGTFLQTLSRIPDKLLSAAGESTKNTIAFSGWH
jgi:hypothetical protein